MLARFWQKRQILQASNRNVISCKNLARVLKDSHYHKIILQVSHHYADTSSAANIGDVSMARPWSIKIEAKPRTPIFKRHYKQRTKNFVLQRLWFWLKLHLTVSELLRTGKFFSFEVNIFSDCQNVLRKGSLWKTTTNRGFQDNWNFIWKNRVTSNLSTLKNSPKMNIRGLVEKRNGIIGASGGHPPQKMFEIIFFVTDFTFFGLFQSKLHYFLLQTCTQQVTGV